MRKNLRTIAIAASAALIAASIVAWAAETNYLGTVFIADPITPSQQLKVNSNGSLNVIGSFSASPPTPVAPTVSASASVTSLVLDASPTSNPGGVSYFHAENATATAGYCVLYNATAAPSAGALTANLVLAFQLLPASGYCDLDRTALPIAASAGAVVLLTSAVTPFTYTTGTITGSIYGLAQ